MSLDGAHGIELHQPGEAAVRTCFRTAVEGSDQSSYHR